MPEFDGHFGAEFDFNPPPFAEAVAWFMDQGIVTRAEFDKLSAAMRTRAFTAARVYAADGLQTVFDALGAAVKTGSTYRDFSRATEDILTRPWHRETVFRTNILSAYGGGHWEQAQAAKDLRPWVIYRDAGDGRVRPRHRLGGLVLHIDDPFVRSHWGPWEFNCRCQWLTLSGQEVNDQGLQITTDTSGLPPANPKFSSPAMGEKWGPDYTKYAPGLASQVRRAVEGQKAIYD